MACKSKKTDKGHTGDTRLRRTRTPPRGDTGCVTLFAMTSLASEVSKHSGNSKLLAKGLINKEWKGLSLQREDRAQEREVLAAAGLRRPPSPGPRQRPQAVWEHHPRAVTGQRRGQLLTGTASPALATCKPGARQVSGDNALSRKQNAVQTDSLGPQARSEALMLARDLGG